MNRLLQILIFLTPSISMASGLVAAPIISLFMILSLFKFRNQCSFSALFTYKAIILFFLWCLVSCFWSPFVAYSFLMWIQVALLVATGLIITSGLSSDAKSELKNLALCPLTLGSVVAVLFFLIEYFTNGIISMTFRSIFQPDGKQYFNLYLLDRGCALLSVVSWIIIGTLLLKDKKITAIFVYFIILYVLKTSDSLASYLAFMLGGLAYLMLTASRMKLLKLIMFSVVAYIAIMPIFSYHQNPTYLSDTYVIMPDSAKHRLFIWDFVAKNAMENPIFGWGFYASKYMPIDEERDVIRYNDYLWSPLPLHPHNNVMQVWLETGIIGLVLFAYMIISAFASIARRNEDSYKNWIKVSMACFINYFVIGMISFGIWQLWWVATGIFTLIMMTTLVKPRDLIESPSA